MAKQLGRARQTIHNVVTYLREGHRALDYVQRYQANKQRCGRRPTVLTPNDQAYVTEKISEGWTPDVIVGRRERPLPFQIHHFCQWQGIFQLAAHQQ